MTLSTLTKRNLVALALLTVALSCAVDTRELTISDGSTTADKVESGKDSGQESGSSDSDTPSTDTDSDTTGSGGSNSGKTNSGGSNSGKTNSGGDSSGTSSDPDPEPIVPIDGPTTLFDSYEFYGDVGPWVDGKENDAGIQGAFFVMSDANGAEASSYPALTHSDLWPESLYYDDYAGYGYAIGFPPCLVGTIAATTTEEGTECDFTAKPESSDACAFNLIWGGAIALNLNESGGRNSVISPYDAEAHGVQGFEFTLSGTIDGPLRVDFALYDGDPEQVYCVEIRTFGDPTETFDGDTIQIDLDDVRLSCWDENPTRGDFDPTQLERVHLQFPALANETFDIEMCIAKLGVY